jgi:hypothetical protein
VSSSLQNALISSSSRLCVVCCVACLQLSEEMLEALSDPQKMREVAEEIEKNLSAEEKEVRWTLEGLCEALMCSHRCPCVGHFSLSWWLGLHVFTASTGNGRLPSCRASGTAWPLVKSS